MEYNICGHTLDKQQLDIVFNNDKYLLVVAGAGSGKTLTILGKIKYLIEELNINEDEILCISFTNAATNSLKDKIKKELNININTKTFHKLAIDILGNNSNIADPNLLDDITHEYLTNDIYNNKYLLKEIKRYYNLNNTKELTQLSNLITSFIHLFKCNNYYLNDYNIFYKKINKLTNIFNYKKEKNLLKLIINIYLKYYYYLEDNNELDFDDLIIHATSYIKNNNLNYNYKYIIIDEYQDTSYIRFNLIKELVNKFNSHLLVVGDDYQSIYRFTGCDISLFLNFNKYFYNATIKKIETTYRNSQELVDITTKFIMKNNKQIKKNMISNKHISKPIKLIYYKDINKVFNNLTNKINNYIVLGRNNNDSNLINKKINYMTIHKSKGLEFDNVIIINLIDDILGFPSQIKNNNILRLVTTKDNNYEEERRLFYVALTRTKNYVYLLVPYHNKSIFIKEIIKYCDIMKMEDI